MKKSFLVRAACLLMITSMLSGCLWLVEDDGYRGGDGRGGHHGEHHGDHEGHR